MIAIASDYDGTLFFHDIPSGIKKEDIQMIQNFQEQGHLFGICTGRPLIGIKELQKWITPDFYILSSGAVIFNKELQVVHQECIDAHIVKTIFDEMKSRCQITIQANHQIYAYLQPANMPIHQEILTSLEDLSEADYFGISLDAGTADKASEIHQEIIKKYSEDIDAYQNIQYIDIVKKGCSKGNGILKVKEYFHIDHMYAIGDSYNDLPMFEQSDYCFTFEESPVKLKEQCQEVVLSVAQAIEIIREGV